MYGTFSSFNLCGTLGDTPTLRATANGTAVINLSLCVDVPTSRDEDGALITEKAWYNVPVFGPAATEIAKRAKKGMVALVRDAQPRVRPYTNKDGEPAYTMEAVRGMVFIPNGSPQVDSDGFPVA